MKELIFVTGASGTGKTTAIKILEARNIPGTVFCYFDSIGIPSVDEMTVKYGSPEEWQKQETVNWVKRIKENYLNNSRVIFDLQARQSFIEEACLLSDIKNYKVVVFVCEDDVRDQRLVIRGQSELANKEMSNWNRYLHEQALKRGDLIVDTTNFKVGQAAVYLESLIAADND